MFNREEFRENFFRKVVYVKDNQVRKLKLVLKSVYNEKKFVRSVRVGEEDFVILVSSNDYGSDVTKYQPDIFKSWE